VAKRAGLVLSGKPLLYGNRLHFLIHLT
jgi:hypothetical protein